jgi:hypothetical protein
VRYHNVAQNTDEWLMLRLGIPTASGFDQIITPKTLRPSESSKRYMAFLLAEWIFNGPLETPETPWMERGKELEDEAVRAYAFETECEPEPAGFFTTDDGRIGASPDRIVPARNRLLEIKCVKPEIHVGYMLNGVDEKYMTQLQGQLWVCEYAAVDIQSYCPGFPTVVMSVFRNEDYIAKLSAAVRKFSDDLEAAKVTLQERYGDFRQKVTPKPAGEFGISDEDLAAIYASSRTHEQEVDAMR